jgi:hypothetical protein
MGRNIATFVLLADPQQGEGGDLSEQKRKENGSILNSALNRLPSTPWPTPSATMKITSTGPIAPDATFIAGDLTQYGGLTNKTEQGDSKKYNPSNYVGGKQLTNLRALYDGWCGQSKVVQLGGCGPIYVGIGNHGSLLIFIDPRVQR